MLDLGASKSREMDVKIEKREHDNGRSCLSKGIINMLGRLDLSPFPRSVFCRAFKLWWWLFSVSVLSCVTTTDLEVGLCSGWDRRLGSSYRRKGCGSPEVCGSKGGDIWCQLLQRPGVQGQLLEIHIWLLVTSSGDPWGWVFIECCLSICGFQ